MFFLKLKKLNWILLFFILIFSISFATQNTISVKFSEFAHEVDSYNPNSFWKSDLSLNNNFGEIRIENINPSGENLSDIYIYLDNASLISNLSFVSGSFVNISNSSNNNYLIHIPELLNGNFSILNYSISDLVVFPLTFNTSYPSNKLFVGDTINIIDTITNTFNNLSYQNSCVFNISIFQNLVSIGNSSFDSFSYDSASIAGTDSANTIFSTDNKNLTWNVNSGSCLNSGSILDINYDVIAPEYIPLTGNFNFTNITLTYNMNETFSNLRLNKILAISSGNLSINKKILAPSDQILHGTNVTWQVNGSFENPTSLNYLLETSSFWVSKKNVDGLYTNISKIDVDGIDGSSLQLNLTPNLIINSTNSWFSSNWLFNYSDSPSPITWMSVNFTLDNDGIQLINSSTSISNGSYFSKEIFIVIGYLLEIEKNVTSIGNNLYNVKINVFNRGNQATPVDSAVTLYDFLPINFTLASPFSYSSSTWYSMSDSNNSISGGGFDGTLIRWAIIPTNIINSSLDKGPVRNLNNSISISYNISGSGDYSFTDIFIVGLDPEKVDGAGSSKSIIFKDLFEKIKGFEEYYFLVFASIISSLILLL